MRENLRLSVQRVRAVYRNESDLTREARKGEGLDSGEKTKSLAFTVSHTQARELTEALRRLMVTRALSRS